MTNQPRVRITEFLSAFFPDDDEKICLRSFKPKGAPAGFAAPQKMDTTRKELMENAASRKLLMRLNERSGIYFLVNSGGHSDEEITRYNAYFIENDTATVEEQGAALDAAPLKPSIRVETSKSIHAYWLVEGDCAESEWREIQSRLITYFSGDDKIKNPSRCMRLPGFDHLTYNGEGAALTRKKVEVTEFHPERRYTFADMITTFPEPEAKPTKVRSPLLPTVSSPSSEYWTWDALNDELRRRVAEQAGGTNKSGNYEMRCPSHDGQGETSLFYNPETGAVKCLAGCSHEDLLSVFGLPQEPNGRVYGRGSKSVSGPADGQEEESAEEKSEVQPEEESDVCMGDVEPEEVEWLIKPYIPLGALTIVEGDPDEGKSFATLAITAALSNGCGLPFGEIEEAGNVLLLSAEDHISNTIRPRLDWLGADVSRVFAMKSLLVFDDKGFERLEERITARQPKMVLFDPLFAYVGGRTNINSDNKVREITNRLAEIAHRHSCAIVALRHLSKAEQRNAKSAGASSIAWTAAARSVLLFGHEPEDEQSRGFVHTKHNLSGKGASQGYRIERTEDGKAVFRWTGECELTSHMILSPQKANGSNTSELERAEDFLFDILQGGPLLRMEVERRSKRKNLSWSTVRRAKEQLGVDSFRKQAKGAWWWKLPDAQSDEGTDEHVNAEGENVVGAAVRSDTQPEAMSV